LQRVEEHVRLENAHDLDRHATEDGVILEVQVSGTHLGPWRAMPATGRRSGQPRATVRRRWPFAAFRRRATDRPGRIVLEVRMGDDGMTGYIAGMEQRVCALEKRKVERSTPYDGSRASVPLGRNQLPAVNSAPQCLPREPPRSLRPDLNGCDERRLEAGREQPSASRSAVNVD
jgi:hypothetical protein